MEGDSEYDREWCEKMLEIATQETSSWLGFCGSIMVRNSLEITSTEKQRTHWQKIGVNTP